jgi:hypothetical protein
MGEQAVQCRHIPDIFHHQHEIPAYLTEFCLIGAGLYELQDTLENRRFEIG